MYLWPLLSMGLGLLFLVLTAILFLRDYSRYLQKKLPKKVFFVLHLALLIFSTALVVMGAWLYLYLQGQL